MHNNVPWREEHFFTDFVFAELEFCQTSRVFAISGFFQKRLLKVIFFKVVFYRKKTKNEFVGQEGRTRFLWCLFIFLEKTTLKKTGLKVVFEKDPRSQTL